MPDLSCTYPGIAADRLFSADTLAALAAACTPHQRSRPGDLIGLDTEIEFDDALHAFPVTRYYIRSGLGLALHRFSDLAPAIRPAAALAAAYVSDGGIDGKAIRRAAEDLQGEHPERLYASLMITPDALLVTNEDLGAEIDQAAPDQDSLDAAVRVLFESPASAHAAAALHRKLARACALFDLRLGLTATATWPPATGYT